MRRRQFLGAAGLSAAAPFSTARPAAAGIETEIVRLRLRHTWTTVMSSSDFRDNLYLHFTRDGVSAIGEGAPIVRYQENAETAQKAVESVRDYLASANPWQFDKVLREVFRRIEGQYAAKSAIDTALMD